MLIFMSAAAATELPEPREYGDAALGVAATEPRHREAGRAGPVA